MIQLIGRLGVRDRREKWLHPLPGLGCKIGELLCVEPATASQANDLKYGLGPVILTQSFGDRINAIRELLYGLLGCQAKQGVSHFRSDHLSDRRQASIDREISDEAPAHAVHCANQAQIGRASCRERVWLEG